MDQVTKVRRHIKREEWIVQKSQLYSSSVTCTARHMLGDITVAENIYIACGYTDMHHF